MTAQEPCCREITGIYVGKLSFDRMVILNWYDGPTTGVIVCGLCNTAYDFAMVDWDSEHEVRIFGLSPLPPKSLDRLLEVFAEPPEWPTWFPKQLIARSEDFRARLKDIDRVLDARGDPQLIVAWSRSGKQGIAASPAVSNCSPMKWENRRKYASDAF